MEPHMPLNRPVEVPIPPWGMAITAIVFIQLGSALSIPLVEEMGPAGAAWLRLSMGAVILLAIARPPLRSIPQSDVLPVLGLGITTGVMTMAFLAAIEEIPLGTAVAVEFLGPLTVAAVRSHTRRALLWPTLALFGVILLTEPWQGSFNPAGLAWAVLSGISWGAYIILTQRIGDRFTGIGALSMTIPLAALTAAILGIPQASGKISLETVAIAAGLAILLPVLPFALEMLALRRMTTTAFGTFMALEPAAGVLLGLIILNQQPSAAQVVGISLVVLAGAAAQRGGQRHKGLMKRSQALSISVSETDRYETERP